MRISDWSSDVCSSDLYNSYPKQARIGVVVRRGYSVPVSATVSIRPASNASVGGINVSCLLPHFYRVRTNDPNLIRENSNRGDRIRQTFSRSEVQRIRSALARNHPIETEAVSDADQERAVNLIYSLKRS